MRFFQSVVLALLVCLAVSGSDDPAFYPRSQGEIKAVLQMLQPKNAGGSTLQTEYIQRLKQYRFLAGIPYENLQWDDTQADLCQHAVKVLQAVGKLTHNPEKPSGMSDSDYALGKKGCGQSNLFQGVTNPRACVDGWMDDSGGGKTVGGLGHRRWCINPPMGKSAFAAGGNFAAMYAFDGSNKKVPDWDFVTYPVRGYQPVEYFGSKWGWNVSPNMAKYLKPSKDSLKVSVRAADAKLEPTGEPLKLDTSFVEEGGYGSGPAIIFRPEAFQLKPDAIYVVEIEGLKTKSKKDATLKYIVHFVSLSKIPDGPELSAAYSKMFQQRFIDIQAMSDFADKVDALTDLTEDENFRQADENTSKTIRRTLADLLKAPALQREQEAYKHFKTFPEMERQAAKAKDAKNAKLQLASTYKEFATAYKDTRWGAKASGEFEKLRKEFEGN